MVLKIAPAPSAGAPADDAGLLVVTHSQERGPEPDYLRPVLARLAQRRGGVEPRVHTLGAGDPPDLSNVGLILFALSAGTRTAFPEDWAEARRIALTADLRWIPALNAPAAPTAIAEASGSRAGQPAGPMFVRQTLRKRAFVFNGEVVNGELLPSRSADGASQASLFAEGLGLAGRLGDLFGANRRRRRDAVAADIAFFEAAPEATGALAAAAASAGLDFAAVDYVSTADGEVRIVAVEPIGDLAGSSLGLLARRRGTARRVERLLDRFAETLDEALARELGTPFLRRSAA